ncbi:putative mycofactocin radical SAM maturase MftC [subsurface metagenome]
MYFRNSNHRQKKILVFQWHITDKCNLKCKHCYRSDNQIQDMPFSDVKRVIDELAEVSRKLDVIGLFGFTGGEPLLRKDIFEILDYLKEKFNKGYPLSALLMSNGTLITSEIAQKMNSYFPFLYSVQISIDGSTPEVHDTIRGKGNFKKALRGLNFLIHETKLATIISSTFHKQNLKDIPKIVEIGERLGVTGFHITRLVPIGRGREMSGSKLSVNEVKHILTYLHKKEIEFEKQRQSGYKKPYIAQNRCLFHLTDPQDAIQRFQHGRRRLGNACAIGFTSVVILADGTILPCARLPIPIGNILEEHFLDIWYKSDLLWEFRRRSENIKGKCRQCEFSSKYKEICNGGAACMSYGYYGDYNKPDPHCWYKPGGKK